MIRWAGLLSLAVVLAGCGRSDLPELGSVSGVVTNGGQPLPKAIVNFSPAGPGRPSAGETDEQGRYSLLYIQDVDGAIVGDHVVTVELLVTEEMDNLPDDPADMAPGQTAPPKLPQTATDGSIKKTVKAGSNTIDIAL